MIVISDTTPIISLLKAGKLELLQLLYQQVIIPEAVYGELIDYPDFLEEKEQIIKSDFIAVEPIQNKESVKILRNVTGLDIGESEALVLYDEKQADLLLIDERKGRNVARKMSIDHIGTVGVLMLAFDEKLLDAGEIKDILDKMIDKNIRLGQNLCKKILEYVGIENKE